MQPHDITFMHDLFRAWGDVFLVTLREMPAADGEMSYAEKTIRNLEQIPLPKLGRAYVFAVFLKNQAPQFATMLEAMISLQGGEQVVEELKNRLRMQGIVLDD